MSRQRKNQLRVKKHKVRAYEGMSQPSITSKRLTRASLYTHIQLIDKNGKKLERVER